MPNLSLNVVPATADASQLAIVALTPDTRAAIQSALVIASSYPPAPLAARDLYHRLAHEFSRLATPGRADAQRN